MATTIKTMADVVRVQAAAQPDAPAITYQGRTLTYADLHERSSRVANGLLAEDVGPDDRIAHLDKNGPEYFDAVFGAAKVRAVCVSVNWRLAPPEMAHIINDAQAKVLFIGAEFAPQLALIEDQLTTVKTIIVIGKHDRHPSYEDWMSSQPADDPGMESQPEDVCMQLYTSGTTGLPKGAMLSNTNFFTALPLLADMCGFAPGKVSMICMPQFHIAGGGWGVLSLAYGCHGVLLREVVPAEILRLIPEHKVTHSIYVPAVLQFMLMTPGVETTDFSSLECIVYGASPISREILVGSIKQFNCSFVQAYGLTETTGGVVLLPPEDHDPDGPNQHRLRSAGLPVPGAELKIADEQTGEEKPTGEVGEIWIKSIQNMLGYWNMPEATEACFVDGWFRSGDAGYVDEDGYVYIHDRVKDMIISGGENIYPAEIENVLMSHPEIADAAAIGVPDDKWGEAVKAVIVKKPGTDPSTGSIVAYCRERLAHYKCPKSIDFVDALPRNPSGKILKKDLRAPFWEGKERMVN